MDKLMKMLGRGEMPDFLEVLQALNDISDIDWEARENVSRSQDGAQNENGIPNYPVLACSEFCESCG